MSLNAGTVAKFMKTLRESNSTAEKCTALTCITSHAGKGLAQALTKSHYVELLTLLLDMVTSCGSNKQRDDVSKSFNVILKECINNDAILFQLALQISRKKRLKFFEFLKSVETPVLQRLLTDKEVLRFVEDSLRAVNERDMIWIAKNATSDSIDVLKSAETRKLSDEEEAEEAMVLSVMDFLQRLYDEALSMPTLKISQFHVIVLDKITTLAYMGHVKQRMSALKLLQTALKRNLVAYVREHHPRSWSAFKTNLLEVFSPRMTLLVTYKMTIWSMLWSLAIQMLGTEAHRNSALINELLTVEEKAFKSSETEIRKQAFICWKYLIDNFALNPEEFKIQKRVKLLCIPLNAKNSKIEIIALTKLEVWWHLIVTMFPVTQHLNPVIVQFLNFCFGPLGDTPLLSKKQNLVASPGKIFFKTKIVAIDALLQMLVQEEDRCMITPVLKERLSSAIPREIFEESHKSFLHSVSEAVIMISNLSEKDLKNREKLCTVLWSNLMHYIVGAAGDKKLNMFKELILVISEMTNHTEDSPLISSLILDFVIPKVSEAADQLLYRDCTLVDLLTKLLTPPLLKKMQKRHMEYVRVLVWQAIKPPNVATYHPSILPFLKTIIEQMVLALGRQADPAQILELWCIFAELMTRYMTEDQPINEGTDLSHNLTTMETLVNFPFKYCLCSTSHQVTTAARYWKHLYNQYDTQADRIPSVKHNLILNSTAKVMVEALSKNIKYLTLVAHCLPSLMETLSYERLPTTGQVPALVYLLRDIPMVAIAQGQDQEAELVLKAMATFLLRVFGYRNPQRILLYLEALRPAIERMLKEKVSADLERVIQRSWEIITAVIIGHADVMTSKFIMSFRQIILLAWRHHNVQISAQAGSILDMKTLMKEDVRDLVISLEQETRTPSATTLTNIPPIEEKSKPIKVVGSFLGKPVEVKPRPTILKREPRRITPLPPDPDSQDYVVIKSDPKFDVNRLTEHQKECLKRRRDDIPAVFNDTSQSGSRDTQDLQEWFEASRLKNESNKENNLTTDGASSSKQEEALKPQNQADPTIKDKQVDKVRYTEGEISPAESDVGNSEAGSSTPSETIAKKLNFESREEFPDGEEAGDQKTEVRRMQTRRSDANEESKPINLSQSINKARRGRGLRGKRVHFAQFGPLDRHLKRKAASDNEAEIVERKRTRRNDQQGDTSDSESIHSTESQPDPQLPPIPDLTGQDKLSEHARREISRLKIDMVAEQVFPTVSGRRRSKTKVEDGEEYVKYRTLRSGDKEVDSDQSQELVKKRRRRSTKTEDTTKADNLSPTGRRRSADPRDQKVNSSMDIEDKSIESAQSITPKTEPISVDDEAPPRTPEKEEASDHDEVVESSQAPVILRSPQRRQERKSESGESPPSTSRTVITRSTTSSPTKAKPEDSDETFIDESKIAQKDSVEQPKKSTPDVPTKQTAMTAPSTSSIAFSSPQSGRRVMRKSTGFSPHGRGAHMLSIISMSAFRDKPSDAEEPALPQRTRPAILRHSERVASPSGSRQEKIFNNMKTGEAPSSAQSAFSNLKNDGEKLSPKKDKVKEISAMDHDYAESRQTDSSTEGQLPILAWSNANPPSLNASPCVSILKRHRSLPLESEMEITPKRKRVSFADPPVSKEMGYEVIISPTKRSKPGIIRLASRRDTPVRILGSRPKMIRIHDPTFVTEIEPLADVDLQCQKENELLTKIADDLEEGDLEDINFDSDTDENQEDVAEKVPNESEADGTNVKTKTISVTSQLQRSATAKEATNNNIKGPVNSSVAPKLHITNDSVMEKILNDSAKRPNLEDTVDIHTISRLNSSANSDELFIGTVPRTSTQVTSMSSLADADTLPITDSMFLSQAMSQCSQGTQNSITLPLADNLDSVNPICEVLVDCEEPLNEIIKDLTNPLWFSHLSNWFNERSMKTIGDLAKMSEKQIVDMPVKGDPKVKYVKSILEKFVSSYIAKLEDGSCESPGAEKKDLEPSASTPRGEEHIEIIEETIEVTSHEREDDDLSNNSGDMTSSTVSMSSPEASKSPTQLDKIEHQDHRESNDYGSLIIDSSMSPPPKTSTVEEPKIDTSSVATATETKQESKGIQVSANPDEILDRLDAELVLQNASKRCSIERQLAEVKSKMFKLPEKDHSKEIMRVLGADTMLKASCSANGIDKVLLKLPDIFNSNEFFAKVLHTYQMKITADYIKEHLNFDEVKQAVREKCSSEEMCDLIGKVLEDEEQRGITGPLKEVAGLPTLLKRIPRDLIISHAVANDEVIPSSIVLDIALQNNGAHTVADAILTQFPSVADKILETKVWSDDAVAKLCKNVSLSRKQWRHIFDSAADQMGSDELLDAFSEAMKRNLKK